MKQINLLKQGGTISLVAPSFGCTTEPYLTRLNKAVENLENDGFKIDKGPNIYINKGKASSNTPKKRAEEFNKAYLESESQAIVSVGGGEVMCEILPFIKFDKIKKAPHKFFMGFSDNTNLTYTLATICEVNTIYGPCAASFAFTPYSYASLDALNLLEGKNLTVKSYPKWEKNRQDTTLDPLTPSIYDEDTKMKLINAESLDISGRFLGGCLDCLVTICGTKFDKTKEYIEKYKNDGIIFFLEACDLSPIGIQRGLFQLKEAGWFKYCKGFIIGRPLCIGNKAFGISHISAVKSQLKQLGVPIVLDASLGHFDPSLPFVVGAYGHLEGDASGFSITYDFSKN